MFSRYFFKVLLLVACIVAWMIPLMRLRNSRQQRTKELFYAPGNDICTSSNPKNLKESPISPHLDVEYGKTKPSKSAMRESLKAILKELSEIGTKNGIRFVAIWGTLLGGFVNNEILPYDDDLDFGIFTAEEFFTLLDLNYETDDFVLKVNKYSVCRYDDAGNTVDARLVHKQTGVFADILFHDLKDGKFENKTRVFGEDPYDEELVMPIHEGRLCGLNLYYPSNSAMILQKQYDLDIDGDQKALVRQLHHGRFEFEENKWKIDGKYVTCLGTRRMG